METWLRNIIFRSLTADTKFLVGVKGFAKLDKSMIKVDES
jgi:hypothetical protein